MRKLFDIVAVVVLLGWAVYYSYDAFERPIRSMLEPRVPSARDTRPDAQKNALHLKIPLAGDNAIGTQRISVKFQQGSPYLADTCVAKTDLVGAELVVLGAYEGGSDAPFEFVEPGKHEVASTIAVSAAPSGKPLVLVVNAYDPVIWNFENFPTDRLKVVIAYGYEAQAVANLPARIPVRFNTRQYPFQPCGEAGYAYKGGTELDKFARNLEVVSGKRISRFNGAYDPEFLSSDGANGISSTRTKLPPEKWQIRASAPLTRKWLLPGEAGIAQLIGVGAVRPATPDDIEEWHRRAAKADGKSIAHHRDRPLFLHKKAYVVTKAIEVPSGLFGMDALDFIVLEGVPRPRGRTEHNDFYFLETSTYGR